MEWVVSLEWDIYAETEFKIWLIGHKSSVDRTCSPCISLFQGILYSVNRISNSVC